MKKISRNGKIQKRKLEIIFFPFFFFNENTIINCSHFREESSFPESITLIAVEAQGYF